MSKKGLKKNELKSRWNLGQIILAGIIVLGSGALLGVVFTESGKSRERVHAVTDNFSSHTMNIAGDFRCSCGTCGEKNLAVCTCETALIEKRYIENSLRAGKSHEQITREMIKLYGLYNGS